MIRSPGLTCLLGIAALQATAAQPPAVKRAAETITEADIRRRIHLIADDSMGGRATPSPGLTKTAHYIAAEFRRFGLKPGGDSGSFLQGYPIARRALLAGRSSIRFSNGSSTVATTLAEGGALLAGPTRGSARECGAAGRGRRAG